MFSGCIQINFFPAESDSLVDLKIVIQLINIKISNNLNNQYRSFLVNCNKSDGKTKPIQFTVHSESGPNRRSKMQSKVVRNLEKLKRMKRVLSNHFKLLYNFSNVYMTSHTRLN